MSRPARVPAQYSLSRAAIRVDFGGELTPRGRTVYDQRDYLTDDLGNHSPDYGDMLAQQLRRIMGIGRVTVSYFGFSASYGRLFDTDELQESVKDAVRATLTCAVPWVVTYGARNSRHYTFATTLYNSGIEEELPNPNDSRLTELGKRLLNELRNMTGARFSFQANGLIVTPQADAGGLWRALETAIGDSVGTRLLTIDWVDPQRQS